MDPRERSFSSPSGSLPTPSGKSGGLGPYAMLAGFVLACIASSVALSAGLYFVSDVEHVVALVNPTDRAITIRLDGAAPAVVGPRATHLLRSMRTGLHAVEIQDGPGATPRTEMFTFTGGRSPMEGHRGVLALAETSWVLVPRDGSGMDAPDRARARRFVPPAPGAFAIPPACDAEIPELPFHPGLAPVASPWGPANVRLCTYEPATRRVGCGLCADPARCTASDRSGEEPLVLESDPS